MDCGVVLPPAHSAAWHVGPALRRPRFVGWPARVGRVGRAATCGAGKNL